MTAAEGIDLAKEVVSEVGKVSEVAVAMCPPYTALESVGKVLEDSTVQLGGQNMHFEKSGAYTGEVSAEMLRHLYCNFVILGHSERREYFKEDEALINSKVKAAISANLKPIICVGEKLEEREAGKTLDVVKEQLLGCLADVEQSSMDLVVIAYEPVWAIGTGKTATPEMAQEVHLAIRNLVAEKYDQATADKVRILYGGSMKPENAPDLLAQEDIDGGLIGGASLKARSFIELIQAGVKATS